MSQRNLRSSGVTGPPHRTAARARLAALLLLAGCAGGSGLGFFEIHYAVEMLSISAKTAPGALEDDGDVKDVKLSDRASFKPSKGTTSGIAKRLRMKSKRDAGAACFVSERETTGNVSSRVRVAFDSIKGLVDGVSLGFLERRPMPQGEEPVLRIEAVYNAGIDGFTIRYMEDGVPVGESDDMPGVHDVHLFIEDLGTSIGAQGANAVGETLDDYSDTIQFPVHEQTGGDETALVAFGSVGLGKSGALYFDQFVLSFDEDAHSGEVEGEMLEKLTVAWANLKFAMTLLPGGPSQAGNIKSLSLSASSVLFDADNLLNEANESSTLHPTTDFDALHESSWEALSSINDVVNLTLEEEVTDKDIKKIGKRLDHALGEVELAIGHVNGLKVSSHSKLMKTATFSME